MNAPANNIETLPTFLIPAPTEKTLAKMKQAARWLVWRREGEKKMPHYADGGQRGLGIKLDSAGDQSRLVTYDKAVTAAQTGGFTGVGFALGPDGTGNAWQGIDLDHLSGHQENHDLLTLPGYAEHSPSGDGVHFIGYGKHFDSVKKDKLGFEAYAAGRYFTFTGINTRDWPVTDLSEIVDNTLRPRFVKASTTTPTTAPMRPASGERTDVLKFAGYLSRIDPAGLVYEDDGQDSGWCDVLKGAHDTFAGTPEEPAVQWMLENWSARDPERYKPGEVGKKWKSFKQGGGKTMGHIRLLAGLPFDDIDGTFAAVPAAPLTGEQLLAGMTTPRDPLLVSERLAKLGHHPLHKFRSGYDGSGTEFVIDGVIAEGPVLLAADRGAGKTTAILPMVTRVTHLCAPDDPLRPTIRRNVIYVSEDPKQVERILFSMNQANQLGMVGGSSEDRMAVVFDRIKVVSAFRLDAVEIAAAADKFATMTVRNEINGVIYHAPPWVIFDTASASFDLDKENDNSEVSRTVGMLKGSFYQDREIPFLIVAHTAKALKHAEVADMSARGAGAWEADVFQVVYLSSDDAGYRYLEIGAPNAKRRFFPDYYTIQLTGHRQEVTVRNRFKQFKIESVIWCSMTPLNHEQVVQVKEEQKEARKEETVLAKAAEILEHFTKYPTLVTSKTDIAETVGGSRTTVYKALAHLQNKGDISMIESYVAKDGKKRKDGMGLPVAVDTLKKVEGQ